MSIVASSRYHISFSWCHTTPDAIFFIVLNRVIETVILDLAFTANRESVFGVSFVFRFWKEHVWVTSATLSFITPVSGGSFGLSLSIW